MSAQRAARHGIEPVSPQSTNVGFNSIVIKRKEERTEISDTTTCRMNRVLHSELALWGRGGAFESLSWWRLGDLVSLGVFSWGNCDVGAVPAGPSRCVSHMTTTCRTEVYG